ncbi:MAG TPA: type IX secretion system sortase PorU, partial [Bacteroidales bacterium]|nr:type IX secretion system sortase PorU [Bacteroidales bacterium]
MTRIKRLPPLIFLVCNLLMFLSGVSAGNVTRTSVRLSWNSPGLTGTDSLGSSRVLSFTGSLLRDEYGVLPVWQQLFPLPQGTDSVVGVMIADPVWEALDLPGTDRIGFTDRIGTDLRIHTRIAETRGGKKLEIGILPLRKNTESGRIEKLAFFTVVIETAGSAGPSRPMKPATVADHSVLAAGTWYKFGVAASGIYRISYDDLKNQGINPATIDPAKIRIYGNGGGMLPESNAASRIDDLKENPILVAGESDGRFDPGDYILFFGEGPDTWTYSADDKVFHCSKNAYSDRMYYFLNFDTGPGKRIQTEPSVTDVATYQATTFNDYAIYDKDDKNLIKSGRIWWDAQTFDLTTQRSYSFLFPNIDTQSPVSLYAYVAARSTAEATTFTVSAQGKTLLNVGIPSISGDFEGPFASSDVGKATFLSQSPTIDVTLSYKKVYSGSIGYLNFIELNAKRSLSMFGSQMMFRSVSGTAPGAVTQFKLSTTGSALTVWEVTSGGETHAIETTCKGNDYLFRLATSSLREFIAFDGTTFLAPEYAGTVANQDLHGTPVVDYIIVTHPDFLAEAERLAAFHREKNGLSVLVTTPDKIYNEFSSGAQDVTAIRDFVRMIYNREPSASGLKYLLLFGDASYDYKNRVSKNTNFVPAYTSVESLSPVYSFVSDDYYGIVKASQGQSANGDLLIGVGRFPVDNTDEAAAVVDKVIHYQSGGDAVRNDWRNVIAFVSDDRNVDEGNLFIEQTEVLTDLVSTSNPVYNIDKIYADAFPIVSTPGGSRYPEVNQAISNRVTKGALLINYIGHGGEVGWAHERILEVPDIKNWKNPDNMPVFVTATCEFSRFDDPDRVSAGEWVLLNGQGGGSALFTTTRLTYAGTNQSMLVNFYNNAFRKESGKYPRLGDLLVAAKQGMGSSANIHSFVLLGDPAMQLAYPELNVATTAINSTPVSSIPDTLKALAQVTISGEVRDNSGHLASEFNGTVFPTVFDKEQEITTRANQGPAPAVNFFLRKNPVYKGQAEVVNGTFTFSFVVPKDIAYQYGQGKISYYARSSETDANGYDRNIQVGGYDNQAGSDDNGPEIALFMNDHNFRSGGITDANPVLLVDVTDTSGINAVGNGIGHDITAILDDKTTDPFVLNDYYVANLNTFKSGVIEYPLSGLSEGPHQIKVKVWDVYNNSATATIDFVVVDGGQF